MEGNRLADEMTLSRRSKRPKKKRRWLRIMLIVLTVILLSLVGYIYMAYKSLTSTINTMHDPVHEISEKRGKKVALDKQEPFSVLLLGVDEREGDRGRSDTMIVMTVNPKKESIEMVSIPRDTRTEIVGRDTLDKINHAYAFGGVEMSVKTVENFLDIPIDYVVRVNMEGFKDIVDAVGGVTVQNDFAFNYEGESFPQGTIRLDGEQALKYARMRKQDPRGDFGRQLRQRQIIEGVIREGASLETLIKYGDIFEALGQNVKTNLTFDEMVDIQANYRAAVKNMTQHEIKGSGTKINGIYYYEVPENERMALQSMLKEHLEI